MNTGVTTLRGRIVAADHAEFQILVERTLDKAYSIAYRMTGNRDDAEEVTQEACLHAYRSFGSYNRRFAFESWFFRILTNLSIDLLRRRKRKALSLDQKILEGETGSDAFVQTPDEKADPERKVMQEALSEPLEKALVALPPVFREAVWLRDVEDWSYEEIARVTKTCIGTVRSRIHRGRTLLRLVIKENHPRWPASDPFGDLSQ